MVAKSCWVMTSQSGMSGSLSQAQGLAEALGLNYKIKTIQLRKLWQKIPIQFIPHKLSILQDQSVISSPFPNLIIASSKRTIPIAIAIKKLSPSTQLVYLQNPRKFHHYFDAIVTPFHDQQEKLPTIRSLGALHRASPEAIIEAKSHLPESLKSLPRPIHAVLLGGNARSHLLDQAITDKLYTDLESLLKQQKGSIVILPSRRTPPQTITRLKTLLSYPHTYLWQAPSPSPYLGMLGHADHLIVTEESVSMLSEACSTGIPTHIYPLTRRRKSKRLHLFQQALIQSQRAQWFQIPLKSWTYTPLNETSRIAELIKKKLTPKREKKEHA